MTPLLSDPRLARQASDGDQRAFEAIYRRCHQDIYRFCISILGRPEDAQDALQNTMLKALRALPGERREIKLKPWLYRIAHNESIDLLRRRREGAELDSAQASAGTEIAETVVLRELETGREMSCEQVTRQLSEADGRVARRRNIRSHLSRLPGVPRLR
jgi:RNA polymerase sigma factor (sigma-70 family)